MKKPDKVAKKSKPDPKYDVDADDVVDLTSHEGPNDAKVRLECTKCRGGNDEAPGGRKTTPVRKRDDPKSVVRCATCGKKHGEGSLTVVDDNRADLV